MFLSTPQRPYTLWSADRDNINWDTLVELQFKHPVNHQVHDFIGVVSIYCGGNVSHRWVVFSWSNHKRRGRIVLPDDANQFIHGALARLVNLVKVFLSQGASPPCPWIACTKARVRWSARTACTSLTTSRL